jgi:hypothetical protein
VGFVVDKVALGQVFPCQFHSTGAPLFGKIKETDHLSLHLHKKKTLQLVMRLANTGHLDIIVLRRTV